MRLLLRLSLALVSVNFQQFETSSTSPALRGGLFSLVAITPRSIELRFENDWGIEGEQAVGDRLEFFRVLAHERAQELGI